MSCEADLDFDAFRRRLERRRQPSTSSLIFELNEIVETCRWVSKDGPYCFEKKKVKDDPECVKLFAQNPDIWSLRKFPENLCEQVFCKLHAAAAKPFCNSDDRNEPGNDAITTRARSSNELVLYNSLNELVLYKPQLLVFGNDGLMHCELDDNYETPPRGRSDFDWDTKNRVVALKTNDQHVPSSSGHDSSDGDSRSTCSDNDSIVPDKAKTGDTGGERSGSPSTPIRSTIWQTPPEPPKSDRAIRAERTKRRDSNHKKSVRENERSVARQLTEDLEIKDDRPGYVYAIRDPELNLIKIGSTVQSISARLGQLRSACKPGAGLQVVAGNDDNPVLATLRLERLIQKDLQPHRWLFHCICGPKKNTRHQEWFDISDETAARTLDVWKNFILQDPYGPLKFGRTFLLTNFWNDKVRSRELPNNEEEHDHHETRLQRWKRLLRPTPMPEVATEEDNKESPAIQIAQDSSVDEKHQAKSRSTAPPYFVFTAQNGGSARPSSSGLISTPQSEIKASKTLLHPKEPTRRTQSADGRSAAEQKENENNKSPPSKQNTLSPRLKASEGLKATFAELVSELGSMIEQVPPQVKNDLIQFRWPLSFGLTLAVFSSYAPPSLAFITWWIFLPCFVAELRSWVSKDPE